MKELSKDAGSDIRPIVKSIMETMLGLRSILPTIYSFNPDNLMIDRQTLKTQLVITDELFKKESKFENLTREEIKYKSPEELFGKGRSLTTPFWVLGVLIYEAKVGFNPWETTLKIQVTEQFIKKYPVHFPEDQPVL